MHSLKNFIEIYEDIIFLFNKFILCENDSLCTTFQIYKCRFIPATNQKNLTVRTFGDIRELNTLQWTLAQFR